ncbi:SICAvar, type I [Plasmodium knowlesi strain H]|uniref:SICAvar, type I n=2 Tax=Plasmodium knowlesi TaxID=5850 RepID=A0A679KTH3_PLAKH|nr:SICAvar, type I [Plasmodium knowlesi strain H]OTN66123.1 SICAvar type I [Plasmodium knowlesi]CAA9987650.1 SICAvar, type I [Plasmodium knowlesi strain H]VVS77124.1 SICAvar, type I [Plasmodium knowlesi strain H]
MSTGPTAQGAVGGGLLEEWMKATLNNSGGAGGVAASNGKEAMAKLKKSLVDAFEELGEWLIEQESNEIGKMCDEKGTFPLVDNERRRWPKGEQTRWSGYLPILCTGVAEIKYFMAGVKTERKGPSADSDIEAKIEHLTNDKAYARCTVGALALSELYGDHCHLDQVIKDVSSKVERKLRDTHKGASANLDKCKEITDTALVIGRTLLQHKIKTWRDENRAPGGRGSQWRLWTLWGRRNQRCKYGRSEEGRRKKYLEENKASLVNFTLGDTTKSSGDSQTSTLEDILVNEDLTLKESDVADALKDVIETSGQVDNTKLTAAVQTLEKQSKEKMAKVCMEDSNNKSFCERLQCARDYWKLTDGNGKSNKDFWEEEVKKKLGELFTDAPTSSSSTTSDHCDKAPGLDNANRAACKLFTAKLELVYKNQSSGKDKFSDQIIQCLLLKEYAKKLKDEAQKKGYCSIDNGLQKAFEKSKDFMQNGTSQCGAPNDNKCFECKWTDTTKDELDKCPISNGQSTNGNVKTKVDELLKDNPQTKEDQIQQTVTDMHNKSTFCERVNCAVNWYKTNGGHGTGQDGFWNTEIQKLWQKLSDAMTTEGKKDQGGCDEIKENGTLRQATPSEKAACNFLHAGFEKLKQLSESAASKSGNGKILDKDPLLRQTVGCLLLKEYAKKMKSTSTCLIESGIKEAFEVGDKVLKSTCNGANSKGPCVPCQWNEKDHESCEISTNVNGGKEPVENKLKDIVKEDSEPVKEGTKAVNNLTLCQRFQCVSERWLKDVRKKGNGKPLTKDDWDDVWEEVKKEIPKLRSALGSATTTTNGDLDKHCNGLPGGKGKEACLLIAAGLKSPYNIDNGTGTGGAVDASFQRTMRCVLLNAVADRLMGLRCKEERSVVEGIKKAFETENENIKNSSNGCNTDDKCFKCERFTDYKNCTVREKSTTLEVTMLKDKVDEVLNKDGKAEMEKIEAQAIKDICKPCTGDNGKSLCDQLSCVAKKWGERNNKSSNRNVTWDDMKRDFEAELNSLLSAVKTKQNAVAGYCKGNGGAGWEAGAAKEANETACKLAAAGLHHISTIQESHSTSQYKPHDHQEFKQFASCLMLKTFVKEMKKRSHICDIEPGIKAATQAWNEIKKNCTKQPCIDCNLKDDDMNDDTCTIGKKNVNVKEKLNDLLEGSNYRTSVNETLSAITKTDQPGAPLCNRLECLASRVNSSTNQDKFWNEDVKKLWDELSQAMTKANGASINGGCNKMDDNDSREPTTPERKACQYLSAGFNQLKLSSHSNGSSYTILTNPSLRQTVGCFLLKEYAKKMKDKSKCLIESGIKKAFGSWNPITNGPCTNGSSCIECKWDDNEYESCKVNITASGNQTENAKTKVQVMVEDNTLTTTMEQVNKTESLCDKLKCAAPNWFKRQKEDSTNSGKTKTWCDFWDRAVKEALTKLFEEIEKNGKDKSKHTNGPCKNFGDGNPHSVERKACNHITAGLDYINQISNGATTSQSNGQDNQLLHGAVGCIALNMYADQIINEAKEKCPIDEEKINEMFKKWNDQNNKGSSPSPLCNGGNNGCFQCKREQISADCQLSVEDALVATSSPSGQNCPNDNDKKDVKKQMDNLLNNEDQSNPNSINNTMQKTFSEITKMDHNFCTQVQCAIKQKLKIKNGQSGVTTTPKWENIEDDAKGVLAKLLEQMTKPTNQEKVSIYCNDTNNKWDKLSTKEKQTNRASCLLFAAGLKHIYGRPNGHKLGPVNGSSFEQTMGCLFLKEYAKQLKDLAKEKRKGHSWVHPYCSIDKGITHAFNKSKNIMEDTSPCKNNINSCFECKWANNDYGNCKIGDDKIEDEVKPLLQSKETHMQQTLENTVCPILLTDILTPFLPLAPVSIGLSAMAYYLWKYFGPLGKGGQRFRRSPAEIRGPSVQEQVLDHVQQDSSHEYQLVKERKPRSAPTRTKRSGRANRRTIIEIHFEVLDECQKGDTQLNQKDFLELLVREFMGSEFMEEEEQVPKEEVLMEGVLMEGVPMESVPMERAPILGSVFMV